MRPLPVRSFIALSVLLSACSTGGPLGNDDVPAAIAVPSGNRLALTLKAVGLQNYECRARHDAPGSYDWAFVAPEAALKDRGDVLVGRHYAGPTWEHGDGSRVVARVVAPAPAPQAGNIPWLLLQGTPAATPGTFAGVTFVQRVRTVGGTAPSDPCGAATIGTKTSVRYSADYLFYRG